MSQKLLTLEDICLVYQIVWEKDKNAFICCINKRKFKNIA